MPHWNLVALAALCSLTVAGWIALYPDKPAIFVYANLGPENSLPPDDPGDPEECRAGCSAVVPATESLGGVRIIALLDSLDGPEPAATAAFEELLFHGEEVREYLACFGAPADPTGVVRALEAELAFDRCRFTARIVDRDGAVRVLLDERVPFGIKQHLHAHDTVAVAPPVLSFTVERVGVKHLWARL